MYRILFALMLVATFAAYSGAVDRCYVGLEGAAYFDTECITSMSKEACHKYDCSHFDYKANTKGCGKCPFGPENGMGCKCNECTENLCNGATRIGSIFSGLLVIGGVVAMLALKPFMAIGIAI